ncbi:MAG: rod shape-determining protein [Bacteroidetes bacterium]|uniref:Rod shape-determining protein n=1 Tax=Candidatus Enterocola intestinipullorum TaxID=2840783 RepID=A0A9D9HCQ6_9BACT|nr:rod shape-determining protein [Candidatus Enterocola intestinipullorum]
MIIAAIDIGTDKIAGAVASKTEAGIELLAFNEEKCKDGEVLHGNAALKDGVIFHLKSICRKLENASGLPIAQFFIGYSGQGLLDKKPDFDTTLEECLSYLANDGKTLKRASSSPAKLTAACLLSEKEKADGCLFIDLGRGTTSSVVYENGNVVLNNTRPAGTDYFFNDLMSYITEDLGLKSFSRDKCQMLINRFAGAMPVPENEDQRIRLKKPVEGQADYFIHKKYVNDVVRARLLANLRVLDKMEAENRFARTVHSIVVCGGGSRLAGFEDYLRQRTGLPVRTAVPDKLFADNETARQLLAPQYCSLAAILAAGNEDCLAARKPEYNSGGGQKKKQARKMLNGFKSLFNLNDDNEKFR